MPGSKTLTGLSLRKIATKASGRKITYRPILIAKTDKHHLIGEY